MAKRGRPFKNYEGLKAPPPLDTAPSIEQILEVQESLDRQNASIYNSHLHQQLTVALASNTEVYKGLAYDAAKIVKLARQILIALEEG